MPQNTPMKRQFTTIDGRTVMSNLPQHWGGNDWAITGVDNPLPVGNYVQTEAGVWIPQKGSDDGAADVRLTGSIVELASGFNDITISAGSTIYLLSGVNLIEQGFTKVCVVIRMTGQLTLQFIWRELSSDSKLLRRTNHSLTAGQNGNDVEVNVLSNRLYVAIVNSSNEDDGVIVKAMILGVR